MKEGTFTGKTVEEAVEKALTELNIPRERVNVEVMDEAKKGFFGIGSKPAVVKVTEVPDPIDLAEKYLIAVIEKMGLKATVEKVQKDGKTQFELVTDKAGVLIGKRGQTLNALQYLTNLVANRYAEGLVRIELDLEGYRSRREETLKQFAKRQAEKAIRLNEKVVLEPMPASERKIIHLILKEMGQVSTQSEGEGMNRHIVIIPQSIGKRE